jgi:hypothetical protein
MNARILDPDLNRYWLTSAAEHVRRRGWSLHLLANHIKERAEGDPIFADLQWTHVRDCILGRDVDCPDPIALDRHVRELVGFPIEPRPKAPAPNTVALRRHRRRRLPSRPALSR